MSEVRGTCMSEDSRVGSYERSAVMSKYSLRSSRMAEADVWIGRGEGQG